MWKRIDSQLAVSEKHAECSPFACVLWAWMLPHADTRGRYPSNLKLIKAQCLPLFDVRLQEVEKAMAELVSAGLLHPYDAGGKAFVAYHDHDAWNPPGALRYNAPRWPAPPVGLCRCLIESEERVKKRKRGESGEKAPPVLVPSSSSSEEEEEIQIEREDDPPWEPPIAQDNGTAMLVGRFVRKNPSWSTNPERVGKDFRAAQEAGVPAEAIQAAIDNEDTSKDKPWLVVERAADAISKPKRKAGNLSAGEADSAESSKRQADMEREQSARQEAKHQLETMDQAEREGLLHKASDLVSSEWPGKIKLGGAKLKELSHGRAIDILIERAS